LIMGAQFPPRCEPPTRIRHWRCSLLCSCPNLRDYKPADSNQSFASAHARRGESEKKRNWRRSRSCFIHQREGAKPRKIQCRYVSQPEKDRINQATAAAVSRHPPSRPIPGSGGHHGWHHPCRGGHSRGDGLYQDHRHAGNHRALHDVVAHPGVCHLRLVAASCGRGRLGDGCDCGRGPGLTRCSL